jgi:hypothetical protein
MYLEVPMPKSILRVFLSVDLILCFCFGQGTQCGSALARSLASPSQPASAFSRDSYQYYLQQRLKSDLFSLVRLGQEITRQAQPTSKNGNYKQVSQGANKIRKLAHRIKSALTFGNNSDENRVVDRPTPESPSPEGLRQEILEINQLVYKIRRSYAKLGRHVINAKLQCELYESVDALESLALHVKEAAEELSEQY